MLSNKDAKQIFKMLDKVAYHIDILKHHNAKGPKIIDPEADEADDDMAADVVKVAVKIGDMMLPSRALTHKAYVVDIFVNMYRELGLSRPWRGVRDDMDMEFVEMFSGEVHYQLSTILNKLAKKHKW